MKRLRAIALILLMITVFCGGCSDEPSNDSGSAQDAGSAPVAGDGKFGEGCKKNADCGEGLLCMQSEFTPTAFCTTFCDTAKDYCDAEKVGGAKALCVQMPGTWNGPTKTACDAAGECKKIGRPFCAPVCDNSGECATLWSSWEKCAKPAYKNVTLYNDIPTKVCMAPSSHGQVVVDPRTCNWEDKITNPKVTEAKQLCKAHCDFLTKCQLFDPSTEAASCCTWRCFQKMTPEGAVDQARKNVINCYIKAFFEAAPGTPKVCELYKEQCPELQHPRG